MRSAAATVDDYLDGFAPDRRRTLDEIRRRIVAASPGTSESVAYDMAEFRLANGAPLYLAGWKHHISLHAVPTLNATLEPDVEPYRSGRGTLKFPDNKPFPYTLIDSIVAELAGRL